MRATLLNNGSNYLRIINYLNLDVYYGFVIYMIFFQNIIGFVFVENKLFLCLFDRVPFSLKSLLNSIIRGFKPNKVLSEQKSNQ